MNPFKHFKTHVHQRLSPPNNVTSQTPSIQNKIPQSNPTTIPTYDNLKASVKFICYMLTIKLISKHIEITLNIEWQTLKLSKNNVKLQKVE